MSGKVSRRRGYRGEYLLRDHLRRLGWKSDRVPSSGAAEGFKGDVKAEKGSSTLLFEIKNHSNVFKTIYQLYHKHCQTQHDDLLTFVIPGEKNLCVSVSTSLDAVLETPAYFEFIDRHPLGKEFKRTFEKLGRMQRLVKEADILVLKDDREPLLFIRYR